VAGFNYGPQARQIEVASFEDDVSRLTDRQLERLRKAVMREVDWRGLNTEAPVAKLLEPMVKTPGARRIKVSDG